MRVQVALTPAELDGVDLHARTVVVIDVFRAATTVATALANDCRAIVPALTPEAARLRAREFPHGEVLLAGERGGEPIEGFDLGNSPLEYTRERVAGRVVILTTTNGTRALLAVSGAAATALGALVNATAIARWARDRSVDLTLACAGEAGDASLEDAVCAGVIIEAMAAAGGGLALSDAAAIVRGVARHYRGRLADLRRESRWGRHLLEKGREEDLAACLALDAWPVVPLLRDGRLVAAKP